MTSLMSDEISERSEHATTEPTFKDAVRVIFQQIEHLIRRCVPCRQNLQTESYNDCLHTRAQIKSSSNRKKVVELQCYASCSAELARCIEQTREQGVGF